MNLEIDASDEQAVEASKMNGRNKNGTWALGNPGRPRGVKDQLTALRNTIFDALFDRIGVNGDSRIQAALKKSKPEHLLALAAKLMPKSVELTLGGDEAPVPIVLDALTDTKIKPALANGSKSGRKVLNLETALRLGSE